ncbi:DUF3168 domain-containing protein [Devosia sp.]|uniref:DUF3168 domain-containing protein n=1 Tax=Devosia sp. TaxID=1871048 RepID=UPI001AC9C3CD|nr:DUF3168 domain-containing protein [Devosia sp.]MBN9335380.1 DUF3168 domain-containing protein [Devosia sp.]
MSADLAVQTAVRTRLIGSASVTNLVPANHILDRHSRPAPDPSIIIGEGQAIEGDRIDRSDQTVFLDLHIWKKEPSLEGVKAIAGAVRAAINNHGMGTHTVFHIGDCRVTSMRYLRDPDGETSHAVVTVEAMVVEVSP